MTATYHFDLAFHFVVDADLSLGEIEDGIDQVADEFMGAFGAVDQGMTVDYADGVVVFTLGVPDQDDSLAAMQQAVVIIRDAIHAAGGSTPGWEHIFGDLQIMQAGKAAVCV